MSDDPLSTGSTKRAPILPNPSSWDPRAAVLFRACLTVAFERFAFYQLFSLYVLFLAEHHGLTESDASTFYGVLLGCCYFAPIALGVLSQRLGRFCSVAIGLLCFCLSYVLLSLGSVVLPIVGLSVGTGLCNANISATVGTLYTGATERDRAVARFYSAVNLGALPSGFCGAWLVRSSGYPAAFLLSSIATLIALAFWLSVRKLIPTGIRAGGIEESDRPLPIKLFLLLISVGVSFFCIFQQSGSTLTLFAKHHTRFRMAGLPLLPPMYQSIQAALVIVLAPLLTRLWFRFRMRQYHKLLSGMLCCVLAPAVMAIASLVAKSGPVSPLWLLVCYGFLAIAEVSVAPIGVAVVSTIAPRRMLGVLMGLWFSAMGIGNLSAGFVGRLCSHVPFANLFGLLALLATLVVFLLGMARAHFRAV